LAILGLACHPLAAQIDFVDLYSSFKQPAIFPLLHHLHELVFDQPGGAIADIQLSHQFQHGDIVLGLAHQVHNQELFGKWDSG
jgi:hypothetical protein